MKPFVFVLIFAFVAQAKFIMSPYAPSEGFGRNKIDEESLVQAATQSEMLYIPMVRYMACSNSGCAMVCYMLGFKYGKCINDSTCHCYN